MSTIDVKYAGNSALNEQPTKQTYIVTHTKAVFNSEFESQDDINNRLENADTSLARDLSTLQDSVTADETTIAGHTTSISNIQAQLETIGDGKSAYQIAVDNGFEGTEEEWLASLKGEAGQDGGLIYPYMEFDAETGELVVVSSSSIANQISMDYTTGELVIQMGDSTVVYSGS